MLAVDKDVPSFLKQLGYPYQINKSNLVSCASPQARGHLFGMFDWLVDAITVSSYELNIVPVLVHWTH